MPLRQRVFRRKWYVMRFSNAIIGSFRFYELNTSIFKFFVTGTLPRYRTCNKPKLVTNFCCVYLFSSPVHYQVAYWHLVFGELTFIQIFLSHLRAQSLLHHSLKLEVCSLHFFATFSLRHWLKVIPATHDAKLESGRGVAENVMILESSCTAASTM